jgi:hypothetical protein
MRSPFPRALAVVACALCLCQAARGDLYNSLGGASGGTDPTSGFGPLANSFVTNGTPVALTDVKLLLTNGGDPGHGTVAVSLLGDAHNHPGAVLANLGTINDTSLTSSLSVIDLSVSLPHELAANTRYWIELTGSHSTAQWSWTMDTSGPGVSRGFFSNRAGVFGPSNGPYQMGINPGTPAPEPSSLLAMGIGGVCGLGVLIRRSRRV